MTASGHAHLEAPDDELDELALRVLAFGRETTLRPEAKASAIRSQFGLTPARYYRILSAIIDAPAALRHDPILVRRLQRMRDTRAAARRARTFRIDTQDPTE